ncbi:hypothetical protein T459_19086 [Capsicum annuum]|uniref:ABC transmembrane type-1 domain-containing protein n=1 Tax=Capsicum annuum TaxID=4072 RepID=A0A2G2Z0S0_CAPAN|nr:hypothetical protein T459_19086 [Capsicum annuum]
MMTTVFMHADGADISLMTLGFIGAVFDGVSFPISVIITGKLMNIIGGADASDDHNFMHNINELVLLLVYHACVKWIASFLEGFCWTRTEERQASRLRIRYLKAVLRRDVSYFDLHVASTSKVIDSVSGDSLIIQDCISEKIQTALKCITREQYGIVGLLILMGKSRREHNMACDVRCILVLVWRPPIARLMTEIGGKITRLEAEVALDGVLIGKKMRLAHEEFGSVDCMFRIYINGFAKGFQKVCSRLSPRTGGVIYGRAVMGISRKIRDGDSKAGTIVEQAISSVRCVELGVRQGLAKGLFVGSTAIGFVIRALMSYYGSRLVMYN